MFMYSFSVSMIIESTTVLSDIGNASEDVWMMLIDVWA